MVKCKSPTNVIQCIKRLSITVVKCKNSTNVAVYIYIYSVYITVVKSKNSTNVIKCIYRVSITVVKCKNPTYVTVYNVYNVVYHYGRSTFQTLCCAYTSTLKYTYTITGVKLWIVTL